MPNRCTRFYTLLLLTAIVFSAVTPVNSQPQVYSETYVLSQTQVKSQLQVNSHPQLISSSPQKLKQFIGTTLEKPKQVVYPDTETEVRIPDTAAESQFWISDSTTEKQVEVLDSTLFRQVPAIDISISNAANIDTSVDRQVREGNAGEYPYALVAGGSKGIGFAIAEALAKRKFNLVLVARGIDTLQKVKRLLEETYKIRVDILAYDLSKDESVTAVSEYCLSRKLPLRMLCNVAGIGGSNDYLKLPLDSLRYMIDLNLKSGISLVYNLLPLLEANEPSYILNVGSMAGFAPIPQKNMYASTKAAVTFFSYALRHQLKDRNISVSCLAPGPVFTKPEIVADTKKRLGFIGRMMAVPPRRVGEIAVRKTLNGKMIIVPGTIAKIFSGFLRIMPRGWTASLYAMMGD